MGLYDLSLGFVSAVRQPWLKQFIADNPARPLRQNDREFSPLSFSRDGLLRSLAHRFFSFSSTAHRELGQLLPCRVRDPTARPVLQKVLILPCILQRLRSRELTCL
jgi:hypothetical protein